MCRESVTQESGPVRPLACVSLWISCVMEQLTAPMERMKLTPLLAATAVSTNKTSVNYIVEHLIDHKTRSTLSLMILICVLEQVSGDVPR